MLHNLTKKATFEHFQFPLKILPAKKVQAEWQQREVAHGLLVNWDRAGRLIHIQ